MLKSTVKALIALIFLGVLVSAKEKPSKTLRPSPTPSEATPEEGGAVAATKVAPVTYSAAPTQSTPYTPSPTAFGGYGMLFQPGAVDMSHLFGAQYPGQGQPIQIGHPDIATLFKQQAEKTKPDYSAFYRQQEQQSALGIPIPSSGGGLKQVPAPTPDYSSIYQQSQGSPATIKQGALQYSSQLPNAAPHVIGSPAPPAAQPDYSNILAALGQQGSSLKQGITILDLSDFSPQGKKQPGFIDYSALYQQIDPPQGGKPTIANYIPLYPQHAAKQPNLLQEYYKQQSGQQTGPQTRPGGFNSAELSAIYAAQGAQQQRIPQHGYQQQGLPQQTISIGAPQGISYGGRPAGGTPDLSAYYAQQAGPQPSAPPHYSLQAGRPPPQYVQQISSRPPQYTPQVSRPPQYSLQYSPRPVQYAPRPPQYVPQATATPQYVPQNVIYQYQPSKQTSASNNVRQPAQGGLSAADLGTLYQQQSQPQQPTLSAEELSAIYQQSSHAQNQKPYHFSPAELSAFYSQVSGGGQPKKRPSSTPTSADLSALYSLSQQQGGGVDQYSGQQHKQAAGSHHQSSRPIEASSTLFGPGPSPQISSPQSSTYYSSTAGVAGSASRPRPRPQQLNHLTSPTAPAPSSSQTAKPLRQLVKKPHSFGQGYSFEFSG